MNKPLVVSCPRCGKQLDYDPENPYRPFCSKRCKESDLYDWLTDSPDEEEQDPGADDPWLH